MLTGAVGHPCFMKQVEYGLKLLWVWLPIHDWRLLLLLLLLLLLKHCCNCVCLLLLFVCVCLCLFVAFVFCLFVFFGWVFFLWLFRKSKHYVLESTD